MYVGIHKLFVHFFPFKYLGEKGTKKGTKSGEILILFYFNSRKCILKCTKKYTLVRKSFRYLDKKQKDMENNVLISSLGKV